MQRRVSNAPTRGLAIRLAAQRLRQQRIGHNPFGSAAATVRWFGAFQAQDYLGALWAVGLRTRGATENSIEQAISERRIVRTWPLRGTLHFVAAEDARWMLDLCVPACAVRKDRASSAHPRLQRNAACRARARCE